MIFPVLLAKFLAAGAVAQAATGAAVVVVAVTGVGAAGALPAPVQDTFSTVVAAVSPLEPATSEKTTQVTTEEVVPEVIVRQEIDTTKETTGDLEVVDDAEAQFTAWALDGPAKDEPFSAWVNEGSKDDVKDWLRDRGFTFGKVVSAWAKGKGFTKEERAALGEVLDKPVDAPLEPDTDTDTDTDTDADADVVVEPETEQADVVATTDERGSRGNGNGNGQAKGSEKSQGHGNGNGKGNGKN